MDEERCATCGRLIYYSQRRRGWLHISQAFDKRHTPTPTEREEAQ